MTLFRQSLLSTAVVMAMSAAYADQTSPVHGIRDKTPQLFAFTNATVHTEPGKQLQNTTVLVADGKIIKVGAAEIPKGYRAIDLKGYHLYPGFIDPFSNYGVPAAEQPSYSEKPVYVNDRKGGNASNGAIHAQRRWADEFQPDAKAAQSYREQGFTTVQSARLDGIFRGQAVVASLADGLPGELILDADANHFMSFSKGSSSQSYPSSLMGSIALIRQTLADANWYQLAYGKPDVRFQGQKVEFNAALAALGQLEQQGVVFESSDDQSLLRAQQLLGEFSVRNASYVGSGYEYARINQFKANGQRLILPLSFPAAPLVSQLDQQLDVKLADLRHWEKAPGNAAAVAKAGLSFAFTLQSLEDKSKFLPNLRKAIRYGLTSEQALAALTTTPAQMVGMAEQLGKIAPGYQADLVIASGDIFKDGAIVATWAQGQELKVKDYPQSGVAGTYLWRWADQTLTVSLSGDDGALTGEVKLGENNAKALQLTQAKQQLQFNLALADLKTAAPLPTEGVLQFSLQLEGQILAGAVLLPSGEKQSVTLTRTTATATDQKDEADKPLNLISKTTFPDRAFGVAAPLPQQDVLIKNATVWTSDKDGKLENTDVLVQKGRFTAIGKDLSAPSGVRVIDATGKHLTAGLIDEHSHIAIDLGVNEGSDAITSEVRIADVITPDDINIYRGLAGGTTTAQLLHGSANPIGGQAQVIQLRWGTDANGLKFAKAPPSIKFALGENVKQANWGEAYTERYPQSRVGVETIIRDSFQAAKEYQAAWAAYNDLSRSEQKRTAPPRVDYRLQALVEILEKKRHIHAHSYVASEILMLIRLADEVGFKVNTFTHILEGYKVADEMKKHGASASTFADWWAYKMEVQDAIPSNTCLMMSRGVLVSVNSDSPDLQRRLNQEAAKSVKYCGMSEQDALNMVTINPAKQLLIDEHVGSISRGKQADFVLWSGHPLSVYSKAEQTWIDGVNYYDLERDLVWQQAAQQEKQALIQKVLTAADDERAGSGGRYKQDGPIWHCEDQGDWLKARFGQHAIEHHSH